MNILSSIYNRIQRYVEDESENNVEHPGVNEWYDRMNDRGNGKNK
jgi:hypothetical protein